MGRTAFPNNDNGATERVQKSSRTIPVLPGEYIVGENDIPIDRPAPRQPLAPIRRIGRPPKFEHPEDMMIAIENYFESCWGEKQVIHIDTEGNKTIEYESYLKIPYTMAGLAMALGMSTSTLRAYGQDGIALAPKSWEQNILPEEDPRRPAFMAIVSHARAQIEEFCERQLHEGRNASTVFNLMQCNFGYRMPKQEVEVNQNTTLNPAVHNDRAKRTREAMLAQLAASPLQVASRPTHRTNTEDAA